MHLLVAILTSHDIVRLTRAVNSIREQLPGSYDFSYDLVLFVNTLDPTYPALVKSVFRDYNIVLSKSNGWPGKGKNHLISWFTAHDEYDYLLHVDGDDFLYPTAFGRVSELIANNQDIVGSIKCDWIGDHKRDGVRVEEIKKGFWLYSWYDNQADHYAGFPQIEYDKPAPYDYARIILLSRKAVTAPIKVWYAETYPVGEDYVTAICALALMIQGYADHCSVSISDIYIYDFTNPNSAVHRHREIYGYDHGMSSFKDVHEESLRYLKGLIPEAVSSLKCVPFYKFNTPALTIEKKIEYLKPRLVS